MAIQKKRSPDRASAEKSASSTAPNTEGGGAKRRKTRLPSELSTALEEAAEQIVLLNAELTKVQAQNKQWLILNQQIGAQKKEITVLQDDKKQLAARKIPIGHDLRHTTWKWDNRKPGKQKVAHPFILYLLYFFLALSAFVPQVLALHIGFHLDRGRR